MNKQKKTTIFIANQKPDKELIYLINYGQTGYAIPTGRKGFFRFFADGHGDDFFYLPKEYLYFPLKY